MADITELLWDDQNIAHIARHEVTAKEVEDVVFGVESLFFDAGEHDRPGRLVAFGPTAAGRLGHLSRHPGWWAQLPGDGTADDREGATGLSTSQGADP